MAPSKAAKDPGVQWPGPGRRRHGRRSRLPEAGLVKGEVDSQHLDLTNPFVNPVYQTLDFQIATTRTRIAALERGRDELMNVKKLGGKELAQLNELYRREIEQARLQANFDLATKCLRRPGPAIRAEPHTAWSGPPRNSSSSTTRCLPTGRSHASACSSEYSVRRWGWSAQY